MGDIGEEGRGGWGGEEVRACGRVGEGVGAWAQRPGGFNFEQLSTIVGQFLDYFIWHGCNRNKPQLDNS